MQAQTDRQTKFTLLVILIHTHTHICILVIEDEPETKSQRQPRFWFKELSLYVSDRLSLMAGEWLTDAVYKNN